MTIVFGPICPYREEQNHALQFLCYYYSRILARMQYKHNLDYAIDSKSRAKSNTLRRDTRNIVTKRQEMEFFFV